jgi:hypothetical protein
MTKTRSPGYKLDQAAEGGKVKLDGGMAVGGGAGEADKNELSTW